MAKSISFNVACKTGFHIKPLTIVVNEANKFTSNVFLQYETKTVNLKSIMGALSLSIPANASITITIEGIDEEIAEISILKVLKEQNLM